jgi:hypothetical protein
MANRKIILRLSEVPKNNQFGFRLVKDIWYIGNTIAEFKENMLILGSEKYTLTNGLLNLLTQDIPKNYNSKDLSDYKGILLLTNGHRRGFERNSHINSSKSWKYTNIIAKLFPARRKRCEKIQAPAEQTESTANYNKSMLPPASDSEESLTSDDEEDPNQLVEQFRDLEENNSSEKNKKKIMCILKKLEKLGFIQFY